MVSGSQLASHPGKKIQEFVKEKTILSINEVRAFVKQQANKACSETRVNSAKKIWPGALTKDLKYLEHLKLWLKADAIALSDRINTQSEILDRKIRLHLFHRIEPASNAVVIPLTQFSCKVDSNRRSTPSSLIEIRRVALKLDKCNWLKSKFGQQLKGGVLIPRIEKLHRVGILI